MDENRTETAFRGGTSSTLADPLYDNDAGAGLPPSDGFPGAVPGAQLGDEKQSSELPSIILAVAGLTVFDAIIIVVFLSLWAVNDEAMLAIIKTLAGIALLLSVAPIVIGGLVLHTNKQSGTVMPGTPWAGVGILVGVMLAGLTLLIPLLAAVKVLLGGPPETV
jgi:hypothetical protein